VSGGYYISEAPVRSLGDSGLRGGGLSQSYGQCFTQTEPNSGHPDDGQTKQDDSDLQYDTSEGIGFHDATLAHHAPGVLIGKTCSFIDADDTEAPTVPLWTSHCRFVSHLRMAQSHKHDLDMRAPAA
jgi:hypothetical protein